MLLTHASHPDPFEANGMPPTYDSTRHGGLEGVVIRPADGKIVTVGTANNLTELTSSRYLAQQEV